EFPAMHQLDFDESGFEWIDASDYRQSTLSFIRRGKDPEDVVVAVFNFTPVPRYNYRLGAPFGGFWAEMFNSDAVEYGGSGQGNLGGVTASPVPSHGRPASLVLTL